MGVILVSCQVKVLMATNVLVILNNLVMHIDLLVMFNAIMYRHCKYIIYMVLAFPMSRKVIMFDSYKILS